MDENNSRNVRPVGVGRLRLIPLFGQFADADLAHLAACGEYTSFQARATICRQGDPADALMILERGHVILYVGQPDDPACIARVIGPDELFGEASLLAQATSPMTAKAFGPCSLIRIPAEPLRALIEQRFDVMMAMLGHLSVRLRQLLLQVMDLKMKTTTQRLGTYLGGLTPLTEGPAEIALPYDKSLLARELGMQPETFSRAMMKLQSAGVRHRRCSDTIFVEDVAVLRRFCEAEGEV